MNVDLPVEVVVLEPQPHHAFVVDADLAQVSGGSALCHY